MENYTPVFIISMLMLSSAVYGMEPGTKKKSSRSSHREKTEKVKKSSTWPAKLQSKVVSVKEYIESGDPIDLAALMDTLPPLPPLPTDDDPETAPPFLPPEPSRFKLSPAKKAARRPG